MIRDVPLETTCVVQLLVEMLAPYKGWVYDPCCGSGGPLFTYVLARSDEFRTFAIQQDDRVEWQAARTRRQSCTV